MVENGVAMVVLMLGPDKFHSFPNGASLSGQSL
jgi:hypothetical protein